MLKAESMIWQFVQSRLQLPETLALIPPSSANDAAPLAFDAFSISTKVSILVLSWPRSESL